ncbi:type II toxin-antitoxin system MqsA family antitoxin [Sedimentibacter sp. B4]|uniref:type II toxin-antitoxin system MqsA family antitoxin n=1 Tax=Sedimentibacter sp. B4 TaxID=304766 RepID=UPI0002F49EFD|nr:type II toxin-antitoxin system MqsA family antitoxin [Sedimentibacter sp. B4]
MKCFLCKGDKINKNTNYFLNLDGSIIIIKNVPSLVCDQCGEVFYENEVMKRIEKIIDLFKNALTEIAIVNYDDKVA